MAYRMQSSVPEVADISDEPESVLELYGPDVTKPGTFARNCLIARRLAERGVKYQTVFHLGWDLHLAIKQNFPLRCREIDQPAAALVMDLKQRGLLDDTLVMFGSEFGRTPFAQGQIDNPLVGRDHHGGCFTWWFAGGGVESRLHARRDRRVQLQHRQRSGPHPRLECDAAAHRRARSRARDVPVSGPRLPPDRRAWQGRARDLGVETFRCKTSSSFSAGSTSSRCICRSASSSRPWCSTGRRAGRATRRSRERRRSSGARRQSRPSSRPCSATCTSRKAASRDRRPTRTGFGAPSPQSPRSSAWWLAARSRRLGRRRTARVRNRHARARVDHGALRRPPDAWHDLSRGVRAAVLALAARRRAAPAERRRVWRPPIRISTSCSLLLELRCGTCHNDEKRNGGFSVGSYDSTLVGGDTGRAVVPGNVEASELLYRVGLAPDDEAFMPAEGKTPLTAQQVAILSWWVAAGAPRATHRRRARRAGRRRAAARSRARSRRSHARQLLRRERHCRHASSSRAWPQPGWSRGSFRRATRGSS